MTAAAFHAFLAHPATGATLDRMIEDFKRIDALQPITVPERFRDLALTDGQRPCDVCGLMAQWHYDGWDGNYLGCEEAGNRHGPPRPPVAPVVDVTLEPMPEAPIGPVVDVTITPTRTRRLLQPGDLPKPVTHGREDFDRCGQSKYGTHRFVANLWTCCEFCGKHYRDCLVKKETP